MARSRVPVPFAVLGVCRAPYEPVITTARGEFEGRAVKWRKKFASPCILRVATGPVFAF